MTCSPITVQKMIGIQREIIRLSTEDEDRNMDDVRGDGALPYLVDKLEYYSDLNSNPLKQVAFALYFIAYKGHLFKQANKRTSIAVAENILGYARLRIESDPIELKDFISVQLQLSLFFFY